MGELFPARVACKVAGISPRKLDYWITSGVIAPHSVYRGPEERRDFFLFTYSELVQLRIVASLRQTGVSLQKIRDAVRTLRTRQGPEWHSLWLVSDGSEVLVVSKESIVETISGPKKGQLSFAIVAMGVAQEEVERDLTAMAQLRFLPERYRGQVLPFREAALGG